MDGFVKQFGVTEKEAYDLIRKGVEIAQEARDEAELETGFILISYNIALVKNVFLIIIIRCQIWNRHWRPCLSKHLCHQTTSKNLNPYFVHLLLSYKDYQEMLFVVCPYRVCLLLYQLKIRIPSLYVYTHVLKIPFASF